MAIDYYKNKNAAIINLNRPQYLNTLNFEMIISFLTISKKKRKNFHARQDRAIYA